MLTSNGEGEGSLILYRYFGGVGVWIMYIFGVGVSDFERRFSKKILLYER